MARRDITSIVAMALLIGALLEVPTTVQSIGVCYGRLGDNIPSPTDTVNLYKSKNIAAMRLYGPDQDALQALRGSNIGLILDVPKPDLPSIASDPNAAASWVQTNVKAYTPDVSFRYIAVGNEQIPGNNANYVLPAMQNIKNALSSAGLDQIKVSTSVSQGVLGQSSPPSNGAFSSDALPTLQPIVQFLAQTGAPLLVNVYPYISYRDNKANIRLDYALFTAPGTIVTDGQYNYQNLFDAIMDSLYSALEKIGGSNVGIVVSESGWPSAGGDESTTVDNARTYNQNYIDHVGKGTPKRPGAIAGYIFAMYNENQKNEAETEKHFGLFNPNQQPVYNINFR